VKSIISAIAIVMIGAGAAGAESVGDFYRDKTITVTVGYSAGGAYDAMARILVNHMPAHLAGHPTMVVKNVPGAGSLVLANQIYNIAPRDGTTFGIIARGMAMEPLIGHSATKYDSTKFTWIGSAANEISLCATYGASAVKTWDDALKIPFVVGGNGSGSDPDVYANVLRNLFGMKAKLVSGYPGTAEISLAMERGEVDGRCGWSWTSIKAEKAQWVADHKLNILVQLALSKAKDLADVPLIVDQAKTERQRQILKLIFSRQTLGRPFAAPPGVPMERAAALREAFDETMRDPAFLDEAGKHAIEINPVAGTDINGLMAELYRTPQDIVVEARRAVEAQ
jgi:tripartite-type tricarboxylate transporter receptor subunit TctC